MSKSWVLAYRIEPPTCVVSARNGANVFFAAYSRPFQHWYMVVPGHTEEEIDEPQMILVEADYAKAHEKDVQVRRPTIKLREGKKKAVQYELAL